MSFSATRLTLYAVLSAMEEDLRALLLSYCKDINPRHLLSEEQLGRAKERQERDSENYGDDGALSTLIHYVDFGDLLQILNTRGGTIPPDVSSYIKKSTPTLESLISVRNRVAHTRPLNYDDLAKTLDVAEALSAEPNIWQKLSETLRTLSEDPSFVLGLKIPGYFSPSSSFPHNLPIPDFDETGFVGREKQAEKLTQLLCGAYPVISILADGGFGKTSLALKVAYDLMESHHRPYDAIIWSSSKTSQLTSTEILTIKDSISTSLGMFANVVTQLAGTAAADLDPVDEIIAYLGEFRVLLILDNLETVLDSRVVGFLQRLPTGSKVLITSRIGIGAFEYPVKIQGMDPPDSVSLLKALAKNRGVSSLLKIKNEQLATYCRRMQYNPGYIKWFVSAVQSGRRPEEVLANPSLFLDFCLSNVYNYLSEDSKLVLSALLSLPGRFSQAELGFLTQLDALMLQRTIQQLLTTNMIVMTSVARGSSFESQYELSEFARAYLAKHQPVGEERYKKFNQKKKQLVAASETLKATEKDNPFSMYSIKMRSRSDLIVAKYLQEALEAANRQQFARSDDLLTKAKSLAPEYFEVFRVEAWVRVFQNNYPAANTCYRAAIELEPSNAPLRFWYAGFLLRYQDAEDALPEFEAADRLLPDSAEIRSELARCNLYVRRFDVAKKIIDSLLARDDLRAWSRRKLCDLNLQYHRRFAEQHLNNHDYMSALTCLRDLRKDYSSYGPTLVDAQMKERLQKAIPIAKACMDFTQDDQIREDAVALTHWLIRETNAGLDESTKVSHARQNGKIVSLPLNKSFGFIQSEDGGEIFFHKSALVNQGDWERLKHGDQVSFRLATSGRGLQAVEVNLSAQKRRRQFWRKNN